MMRSASVTETTAPSPDKKAGMSNAIKKAAARVKRASRGRPPLDPLVPTTGMSLRMTLDQRAKVDRLGGAVFLRKCIDNAPEPTVTSVAQPATEGIKAAA
jgi:hypothetical protein